MIAFGCYNCATTHVRPLHPTLPDLTKDCKTRQACEGPVTVSNPLSLTFPSPFVVPLTRHSYLPLLSLLYQQAELNIDRVLLPSNEATEAQQEDII